MSRSFFKENLASGAPRRTGIAVSRQDGTSQGAVGESAGEAARCTAGKTGVDAAEDSPLDKRPSRGGEAAVEIYDDVSVCTVLGIRRRILAAARKVSTRGADWDAVGEHAGMTRRWVEGYCREYGIPFGLERHALKRIEEDDGVVSVVLVGFHANPCVGIVEIVTTGKRQLARIRDIREHPMYNRECFDCQRIGNNLEWVAKLNRVVY